MMNNGAENKILKADSRVALCPFCNKNCQFNWDHIVIDQYRYSLPTWIYPLKDYAFKRGVCVSCAGEMIYIKLKNSKDFIIIYPNLNHSVKPSPAFKNYIDSYTLFTEASLVANNSPRAGMALARMCIESLANHLLDKDRFNSNGKDKALKQKLEELKNINKIQAEDYELLDDIKAIGDDATHNVNQIDNEKSWQLNDVILVLDIINDIIDNIANAEEKRKILKERRKSTGR